MTTPPTRPPEARSKTSAPASTPRIAPPEERARSGDIPAAETEVPRRRSTGAVIAVIGLGMVVLLGAGLWWFRGRGAAPATDGDPAGGRSAGAGPGAGGGADRAVSVLTAPVTLRDVPIYLEGIGSVAALKTVMVKPQVDGRLDKTAFEEGKPVHKGDLLAQIDPRPFAIQRAQAQAALARDTAQLRGNRVTLERYESVRKQNLIAQQQVDDQRALVDQQQATILADQAQLDQANLQLDYARIRSPIDGVTGVRLVDPGNIIRASDPTGIVMVTQLDPIAVLFSLPQDDLPRVAAQMANGELRVDVLSRDGATPLGTGKLALIDNQINQTTASIRLKAVLENAKRTLWPNQFVKVRLLLSVRKQALVVPAAAIQRGPQGTFLYMVADDQKAVVRPVKIDAIEGDTAVVTDGVSAGEQVVTEGQAQLRPGARVTVHSPSEPGAAGGGDAAAKPRKRGRRHDGDSGGDGGGGGGNGGGATAKVPPP